MVYVLDGENSLGATPLVEWADLLTTGMEGCVTPGEQVGIGSNVLPHG